MPSPVATSTAPAFKAALLAALNADTNLTGTSPPWQITALYPGSTLQAQAIYYGKTTSVNTLPVIASSARVKRGKDYIVELHFDVSAGMKDTTTAENLALEAMGEVDTILATAPQGVGGILTVTNAGNANTTGAWKAFIEGWEIRPFLDDARQGWAVLLTARIAVSARLG